MSYYFFKKNSLINGEIEEYSNKEYAYLQRSKYWIEFCFVLKLMIVRMK